MVRASPAKGFPRLWRTGCRMLEHLTLMRRIRSRIAKHGFGQGGQFLRAVARALLVFHAVVTLEHSLRKTLRVDSTVPTKFHLSASTPSALYHVAAKAEGCRKCKIYEPIYILHLPYSTLVSLTVCLVCADSLAASRICVTITFVSSALRSPLSTISPRSTAPR